MSEVDEICSISEVLLLDYAFNSWKPSAKWLKEVQDDLNRVGISI